LSLAPGPNTVSARALRPDGKVGSTEVVAVVNVKAAAGQPVLRVLAVGISQYDDATFKNGVKFATRDAEDVVERLRRGPLGCTARSMRRCSPAATTRGSPASMPSSRRW
jgi:hypothetical protein